MIDYEKIRTEIEALYNNCLANPKSPHQKIDICPVPNELAVLILETTGLVVSNFWLSIDNYGIIHTLNHHGNPISEAQRGQIAIEKADFLSFLDVVLFPDEIKLIGNTFQTKLQMIQFEQGTTVRTVVVKELRQVRKKGKINRLVLHTMYKKHKSTKQK